eukprot:gene13610-15660_t
MAVGGVVEVDYNVRPQNVSAPSDSYLLLLIMSSDQKDGWYGGLGKSDTDVTQNINNLCNQPAMLRREIFGSGSIKFDIDYAVGLDQYSVGVLQCREGYTSNPVSVDLTLNMKNARPESDSYSHFPIEQVMEVRVLQGELILYALMILGMCGQLYVAGRYARHIHYVFLLTLVTTFIYVAIKYGYYYDYNRTGSTSTSLMIAQNVFGVFSNGMFLLSLLLLSVGWTMIRSSLLEKEVQLIQIGIGAYFAFGIAGAVCINSSDTTCQALDLVPFIIQSLILLGVIIAMNFSVTQLRAMVYNSPWVPSTPLQYARHQQYHVFRLVFLLYLLLPTAFLIFRVSQFGWEEAWIGFVLTDLLDIALIFHIGVTFSPLHEVLLIRAFDGSVIGQEPAQPHPRAE